MRRRALPPVLALALLGPAPLLLPASTADTPARAQCGDSTAGWGMAPARPAGLGGGAQADHHKPDHKNPPASTPPKPKPTPPPPPPPPPPPSVTVASANLLHGLEDLPERTLEHRLEMQADQLYAHGVGAIGAQEVSRTTKHGWIAIRLAWAMSRRTNTRWYWCYFATNPHAPGEPETRDGGGGPASDLLAATARGGEAKFEEGVAVISRWPIVASEVRRLPVEAPSALPNCATPGCAQSALLTSRAALRARLNTPIGLVDLTSAQTGGTVDQSHGVAQVANAGGRPAPVSVIACDCAAVEGSTAYSTVRSYGFQDAFRVLYGAHVPGYTADQTIDARSSTVRRRVDYVFVRGAHTREARVALNAPYQSGLTGSRLLWPSDHYAVVAKLTR